jgi:hypothetical protein
MRAKKFALAKLGFGADEDKLPNFRSTSHSGREALDRRLSRLPLKQKGNKEEKYRIDK